MSTAQLQQTIIDKVLMTDDESLLASLLEIFKKKKKKTAQKASSQATLPPHIRKAIGESLEEYERGEYTTLKTDQEIDEYLESLVA